ncbi:ACP S-malonyltransferase [Methylococcus capsulatus]|uniref:ACP S-malonyltransferase n=1 Tax=Methylococcus capsulatus TaxID=414 RepID=UPI001C52BE29|nr:ACP S-malonyltransferase [Methylococcus capsulatus]QXP87375.1 ACP S-malonyltransferase [Methylococcus capsulatus]QXP92884.1 ACP S-malonyltransferase [Methylococcus capsulatus]UQN12377.1 ACP S-malonyltransferase [Methylococcus capsulatus]
MPNIDNSLAFLFPGQGSQSIGMLADLAAVHPVVGETFAEASEVLGFDLWCLVQEGPEEELNQTVNTQPAMLAAGVATWRIWCSLTDRRPAWMAGHSLGEYSALVAAGALGFADAVKLVAQRGRLMQEAVPPGAGSMAAILGLEDPQVVAACKEASTRDSVVTPANFNAPGQVVIAGASQAVERAIVAAKALGAKRAVLLPVSVPSHCALMAPASEKFAALLSETSFESPRDRIGVVHNVDVATHPSPEVIRAVLAQQISQPVRWSETIRFLSDQGVRRFVECGPGKVLAGLNKRIVSSEATLAIVDQDSLNTALESIQ